MDALRAASSDRPAAPGSSGAALQVTLLGRFAVAIGGAEVAAERWPSLRSAQLVQLLALQPRHRLAREQAIDALWPSLPPDAGGANLRKAMHHARQALGRHDAIVARAGEIELWPERPLEIDAEDFEQRADTALRSRDAAACADAASSYGGDLLPGARYEPWAITTRERLQARHAELLRASAQWDKLARLDPTDEGAHRALMQRELEAGNRAAALRWYGQLREALQQVLGVAPERATEALYARCLAGLQASGPPFVGRALALAQAAAWLALPAGERPGAIVLSGPAGIGKTALAREIAAQAQARGWRALRLDAAPAGRGASSAASEALATTAALAETLIAEDRARLDAVGAAAREVLALLTPLAGPARSLPGPLGRHQIVGAIRRLLLAAAAGGELLLHVDDAQRLGDADGELLLQLAMAGAPLTLLLGVRASDAGSASTAFAAGIARLERAGAARRIDLGPLDDDECSRLVRRAAAGDAALDDALVARVQRQAQGNPFATIELARCALAGGASPLPASTAAAIAQRLADVPGEGRSLLPWLALGEDEFDTPAVEAFSQAAQAEPMAALDACLGAGVLLPTHRGYRFTHDLVREALAAQIPPHRRAKMHARLAELLAERDANPAEVARHWMAAGRARDAGPWLLAAARAAQRVAAFGDALRHLDALLAHEPEQREALRLRAEALDAQGDPAALPAYHRAAAVARAQGGDDVDDLLAKAALAQVKQGDPKGALEVLRGLSPASIDGRLCEALAYSGAAALGATDPAQGTAKAAIARRLALQSGDTAAIVVASWAQAAAAHARGELHKSVWADLHDTSQVPHLAMRVFDGHLCITQRFLYGARPYPEVIAFAEALADEARRLGAARGQAFGLTLRGEAEWLSGDIDAARAHLHDGARLHHAIGGAVGEAHALQRLAEIALHQGRRDEARTLLDESLDIARQTDIGFHLLDRIYGTRIGLHAGDPQAALHATLDAAASVRGPLETCPGCRITFAVPAAIAAARAGEVELAEGHETQCAYLANVVMRLPAWYAAHDEVRGHLAAARDAPREQTQAHFVAAAARFAAAGQPLDAARCEATAARSG